MRRLLTPGEVQERLGVERRTLHAWRQAGTGPPAVRIGKYLRYPDDQLDAWIDQQISAQQQAS